MELQKLYSYVRQAVDIYHMIDEGDRIAVGLSGGKDSVTLLYALAGLSRFYPKPFTVVAITVNLGMTEMDYTPMRRLCEELSVEYHIVDTKINQIVFGERKEKNPCSLCAKLRKGALNDKAKELGCNKIAYAHHREDFVETFFMSLFVEGRVHSLSPMYPLDRTGLTMLRPLFLTPENKIRGFMKKYNLPIVKNACPADGNTKRQEIKDRIHEMEKEQPDLKEKVFTALCNADFEDWPKA